MGWGGVNCETSLPVCQEQCSGHGTFLLDTGVCNCDPKWTGSDCSTGEFPFNSSLANVLVRLGFGQETGGFFHLPDVVINQSFDVSPQACSVTSVSLVEDISDT